MAIGQGALKIVTVVAGVDVGLTRRQKSTGLCRTRDIRFLVTQVTSDRDDHSQARVLPRRCDIVALGGPVVSPGFPDDATRGVERMFSTGVFQKRCKPANGLDLRRESRVCIEQVMRHVKTSREMLRFPHVVPNASVVEASPLVFLSVMLDEETHRHRPSMSRGAKFSWVLERCVDRGRLAALRERLEWSDDDLWGELGPGSSPAQQAAVIGSLTAISVVRKRYVAVGDLRGGYFFLPPWDLWAEWAKKGIADNRQRPEVSGGLEMWFNAHPREMRAKLPA